MMKWIAIIGRTLLGLLYLFSAVNYFFHLGDMPEMEGDAANFVTSLANSGVMTVVKVIEIVGGVLLVSGQYVRFAAIWLLPVTIMILLFHALLVHDGLPVPLGMLLVNVFLLYYYRSDLMVVMKRR